MLNRIKAFYQRQRLNAIVVRFLMHNLRVWRKAKTSPDCKSEVLFEQNRTPSSVIATSYLANVLAECHQSKLVAYSFSRAGTNNWLNRLYSSFNFKTFLNVSLNGNQLARAEMIFEELYPTLKELHQIERISIDGVWIGDLVYDEYLRQYNVPTIDIADPRFIESLKISLGHYIFWKDYLDAHDVKAVGLSHCVYKLAIPLRLAAHRGIPVYQINATHVYYLTKDNLFAYSDFTAYPKMFASLPTEVRDAGILEAQKRIARRLGGEVGVDMKYSKKSAYAGKKEHFVLRKSDRIKILIAPHSFVDAPHAYGLNLFPDFCAWLDFLGQISESTDYDWYIKTHPDCFPEDPVIVNQFVQKYPKFTLLAPDTSHHQIIEEGIHFALTIHGTIAFEYAALGVPVITASLVNPYIAYHFNIHPKDFEEYRNTLMNLEEVKMEINQREVYEYYFMHMIYTPGNWLYKNYSKTSDKIGSSHAFMSPQWYSAWIHEWSPNRHQDIISSLNRFVESKEFCLSESSDA